MSITVSKVEGQSDDSWEFVKSAFVSPEQYELDEIIRNLGINVTWYDDEQKAKEYRQAVFILTTILFWNGWSSSQNISKVLHAVREWKVDEAVFYEMKDTVEAYKSMERHKGASYEQDKADLDKSIKDLIELG